MVACAKGLNVSLLGSCSCGQGPAPPSSLTVVHHVLHGMAWPRSPRRPARRWSAPLERGAGAPTRASSAQTERPEWEGEGGNGGQAGDKEGGALMPWKTREGPTGAAAKIIRERTYRVVQQRALLDDCRRSCSTSARCESSAAGAVMTASWPATCTHSHLQCGDRCGEWVRGWARVGELVGGHSWKRGRERGWGRYHLRGQEGVAGWQV